MKELLDIFKNITNELTTIYVSIGSASLSNIKNVSHSRSQQFPCFLRSLKSLNQSIPIHIILIDPSLEEVPQMITINKNEWIKIINNDIEIFYNEKENIHVYCIRKYVKYCFLYSSPYFQCPVAQKNYSFDNVFLEGMEYLDITEFLSQMNNYAKENNWFFVFHDFVFFFN